MTKKDKKVVYYCDPLKDDFAKTNIKVKPVDKNFKFIHKNLFWRFLSFFIHYLIAVPLLFVYVFIFRQVKFVNKKAKNNYYLI